MVAGVDSRPDLRPRARKFALACLDFARTIPKTIETRDFISQFLRASSSVSFNYSAARRARSRAEFIAKLGVVVEEADETLGWLEFFRDGKIATNQALLTEANELCAIFNAALATARRNRNKSAP
jgi:four helix bundle protein